MFKDLSKHWPKQTVLSSLHLMLSTLNRISVVLYTFIYLHWQVTIHHQPSCLSVSHPIMYECGNMCVCVHMSVFVFAHEVHVHFYFMVLLRSVQITLSLNLCHVSLSLCLTGRMDVFLITWLEEQSRVGEQKLMLEQEQIHYCYKFLI